MTERWLGRQTGDIQEPQLTVNTSSRLTLTSLLLSSGKWEVTGALPALEQGPVLLTPKSGVSK